MTEEDPYTARRAAFYKHMGFVVNRFPYSQPPLRRGAPGCPLWIVTYGRAMGEEEFLPHKEQIYRHVYSCGVE